jgi:DNA modification methylase
MGNAKHIRPYTPIASLGRSYNNSELAQRFDRSLVSALVGMSPTFVSKVLGHSDRISLAEVLMLIEQDAFSETFVPRSKIPNYLLSRERSENLDYQNFQSNKQHQFLLGSARDLIPRLNPKSVQCVVTSTPYWGMRLYEDHVEETWADGETCALGNEQTPEGFIRHTIEILYLLKNVVADDGSIWWNLMDSYNTRTQIRENAAETLRAMKGKDKRSWKDYETRRYSAGHSFLKDGEQCMIPERIVERAARIGYWVKSKITWKKIGSMPETVDTRVTRELEYIFHLSLQRAPYFDKSAYLSLPQSLGGRNPKFEGEKITDVWSFSTSPGTDGHGAQFPLALPVRCIALSTREGDVVLDPFVGSGTTSIAAARLNRGSVGFDISATYLATCEERLSKTSNNGYLASLEEIELADSSKRVQISLWEPASESRDNAK